MSTIEQPGLFDAQEGRQAKETGMQQAAENKADLLTIARGIAVALALDHPDRTTNADMVGQVMEKQGLELGPAAGSIFRGSQWEFTGQRIQSTRISNHGRELKVWRYKGE